MQTRIAFVNGKGGVGKTTCAILMAAALQEVGWRVSIDDRDPQRSATTAGGIFGIPVGCDSGMVIIDTAPSLHDEATIDAIRIANLVVLVTSPSPLDFATTMATANRIKAERGGATRVLFNLVLTNNRFFDEMQGLAKELPFPACRHFLVRRTSYQTAQIQGWKGLTFAAREEFGKVAVELAQVLPKECRTQLTL